VLNFTDFLSYATVCTQVLAYNTAAADVVAMKKKVSQCDVHAAVVQHCGMGYSACDIAQCKGPHFTEKVGLAFM
jgi:hypothetical protein